MKKSFSHKKVTVSGDLRYYCATITEQYRINNKRYKKIILHNIAGREVKRERNLAMRACQYFYQHNHHHNNIIMNAKNKYRLIIYLLWCNKHRKPINQVVVAIKL